MKIAILTSGGDAPGMNSAIRASARAAFSMGLEPMKVQGGYRGLLEGDLSPVDRDALGGILHRGGTVLGTQRSREFTTEEGQRRAADILREAGVEGLVVIGGEGSLTGASKLQELGIGVVGIPATIDNDVWGTEISLGVDTALNTALETIDRLKDTAFSHNRTHVVEVMGRNCGYLALMSAIAGGAEAVLVPEFESDPDEILDFIKKAYSRGKSHFIVVAAEGAKLSAEEFHEYVNEAEGAYESRLSVLGHAQRGGNPTAFDRILGSRFGTAAVETLAEGKTGVMIGLEGNRTRPIALEDATGKMRPLNPEMYRMAGVLSELPN